MGTWAVALVDDDTSESLEYRDYRGWVVLEDDVTVAQVASKADGIRVIAGMVHRDELVACRESHRDYGRYFVVSGS